MQSSFCYVTYEIGAVAMGSGASWDCSVVFIWFSKYALIVCLAWQKTNMFLSWLLVLKVTVWCLLIGFPLKSFSALIIIGEAECFREKREQLNHIKDLLKNWLHHQVCWMGNKPHRDYVARKWSITQWGCTMEKQNVCAETTNCVININIITS